MPTTKGPLSMDRCGKEVTCLFEFCAGAPGASSRSTSVQPTATGTSLPSATSMLASELPERCDVLQEDERSRSASATLPYLFGRRQSRCCGGLGGLRPAFRARWARSRQASQVS
jgi:hypothetical protein